MGQRLVLNIIKNNEILFSVYQHWGGFTDNEVEVICSLCSAFCKKDNLETLLKKTTSVLPGSGLVIPKDPEELKIVQTYLDKDFPEATDRNAGLIAITPQEIEDLNYWADDLQNFFLDQDNYLCDLLYYTDYPEDYICPGETVPRLPEFFNIPITKKNATQLLKRFLLESNQDIYVDEHGNYLTLVTA